MFTAWLKRRYHTWLTVVWVTNSLCLRTPVRMQTRDSLQNKLAERQCRLISKQSGTTFEHNYLNIALICFCKPKKKGLLIFFCICFVITTIRIVLRNQNITLIFRNILLNVDFQLPFVLISCQQLLLYIKIPIVYL